MRVAGSPCAISASRTRSARASDSLSFHSSAPIVSVWPITTMSGTDRRLSSAIAFSSSSLEAAVSSSLPRRKYRLKDTGRAGRAPNVAPNSCLTAAALIRVRSSAPSLPIRLVE